MKILVIPDVHLKPWMFRCASDLLKMNIADKVVCLMDIADDWKQQFNLDLYVQSYDAAIEFAKEYPDTLWCYGNHDVCYLWNQRETGYSKIAPWTVNEKLRILKETLPDERQIAFVHRIDDVLFLHGGLPDVFVKDYIKPSHYHHVDKVVETINTFDWQQLWHDESPIWYRPQYYKGKMYKPRKLLQVVGHTPVRKICRDKNVVSCDVFSTDSAGKAIGSQQFLLIDTVTWEFEGVSIRPFSSPGT